MFRMNSGMCRLRAYSMISSVITPPMIMSVVFHAPARSRPSAMYSVFM